MSSYLKQVIGPGNSRLGADIDGRPARLQLDLQSSYASRMSEHDATAAARRLPPSDHVRSIRAHVLEKIAATPPGTEPFRHLYVEEILPNDFYEALRAHMLAAKADRRQANPWKATARFNLMKCQDPVISSFRAVFSDREVITALAEKFYMDPSAVVENGLVIHKRFEYMFTRAGRSQTIHVDIPPKYISLVFYIPQGSALNEDEELRNATMFYGDDLEPRPCLRFIDKTACVFAPHFRSYHGYASTVDRDVLVMFYSNPAELEKYEEMRSTQGDAPPFEAVRDLIEDKLRRHPLIEFGRDEAVLRREREACRINAPQGVVLKDAPGAK